jgi:hypothetical protein|tara:strand:+ start:30 stop:281 length:252 start_codon:yes stop_codon:yes gene_type:complete
MGDWKLSHIIMQGKLLRQVLDKLMKAPIAQEARVQVVLPNGEFYDVTGLQLLENKLLGVRETHRIAITIEKERWKLGQVVKKV